MGMFGRKIGKALGAVDRGLGRAADELVTPTTGIGKFGQALLMGFDEDYQAQALAQQEAAANEQYRQAQIAAALAKIGQPEYRTVGNDLVAIGQDGTPTVAYQGQPDRTTFERELMAMGIDPKSPEARQMYVRRSPGFQYTPEGIQAAATLAGATAKATAPFRGAQGGGGRVGLKVGQVVDGFTYIGGNPNDRSSWR